MRRRAAWWTMTLVLAVATVGAAAVGGWHLWVNPTAADSATTTVAQPVNPADQADKRNAVLDVVSTNVPKLLSYTPENVESVLTDAISLTTGQFKDEYDKLIHDVVISGAQQQRISATTTVSAAGIESLTGDKAIVVTFINQTITVGEEPPKTTASTVRIGLVKIDGNWLIEAFHPI